MRSYNGSTYLGDEHTFSVTGAVINEETIIVSDDQGKKAEFSIHWLKLKSHIDPLNFANQMVNNKSMTIFCKTESKSNTCKWFKIGIAKAAADWD